MTRQWNGHNVITTYLYPYGYTAVLDIEPPTGHPLDEPEPWFPCGYGNTAEQATGELLQELIDRPEDDPTREKLCST